MNERNLVPENIPLAVINKGKPLGEVLEAFQTTFENAKETAPIDGDEAIADSMMCAAYMVYLIGVMDGMKGDK